MSRPTVRHLDHTADLGFELAADTREELFATAALEMVALITDPDAVAPVETRELRLTEPALDLLLVSWLDEILFLFDGEAWVAGRLRSLELAGGPTGFALHAVVAGEPYQPDRHAVRVLLKAVTLHGLYVRQEPDGRWRARVIFDI